MPLNRHLWRVCACITLATPLAVAHSTFPNQVRTEPIEPPSLIEQIWNLPFFRFFSPEIRPIPDVPEPPAVPTCLVEPLPPIDDLDALSFESSVGSSAIVNLDGLTPNTARALGNFKRIVHTAGGILVVTSAYRPSAYQEHLQGVWDKWMIELRDNVDEGCQELKADIAVEFTRHQLLESQRPATASDHTRGISFDANVMLPARARFSKRRFGLDLLARKAGIRRPHIASDPVHFRLIGG